MIFSLILGLHLLSTPSFAQDASASCSEFRLDEPGGSMEHVPMRDQRDLGTCFAYSGSDLVDTYRFTHGDTHYDKLSSPLDAAIESGTRYDKQPYLQKDKTYQMPFENGDACTVVNYLREHGSCELSKVEKAWGPEGVYKNVIADYALFQKYEKIKNHPISAPAICSSASAIADLAPAKGLVDVLAKALDTHSPLRYFQYLMATTCPANERIPASIPACKQINSGKDFESAFNAHFNTLLKKAQPMEIGYCSDLLEKGHKYAGLIKNKGLRPLVKTDICDGYDPGDPEDDGGHSSTVVGRRYNNKTHQCQILIKNSWGTTCKDYSKDWDCDKGKIWVDEKTLSRNIISYSVIGDGP